MEVINSNGVFFQSVMSACEEVNRGRKLPYFIHHFENFG